MSILSALVPEVFEVHHIRGSTSLRGRPRASDDATAMARHPIALGILPGNAWLSSLLGIKTNPFPAPDDRQPEACHWYAHTSPGQGDHLGESPRIRAHRQPSERSGDGWYTADPLAEFPDRPLARTKLVPVLIKAVVCAIAGRSAGMRVLPPEAPYQPHAYRGRV